MVLKEQIHFYEKIFGWKISKWEGQRDYWFIKTGDESEPGIDGSLMKKGDPAGIPCSTIAVLLQYYCSTIAVPSVDEFH